MNFLFSSENMTTVPSTYAEWTCSENSDDDDDETFIPLNDENEFSDSDENMTSISDEEQLLGTITNTDVQPSYSMWDPDLLLNPNVVSQVPIANELEGENIVLVNSEISEVTEVVKEDSVKKLTRKRKAKPEKWAKNVRQRLKQSGKAYTSIRGKAVPEKNIRKACHDACTFKCSAKFSSDERTEQFMAFYKLTTYEKKMFISKTTECSVTKQNTTQGASKASRRKNSYKFYFENYVRCT